MREIVFLLEEPSAAEMLKGVLPRLLPDNFTPRYLVFEGKQDLERQMVRRMRGYNAPDALFVVMRDQDAGDCKKIKAALKKKCGEAGKDASLVRIVCRELESWYLADLAAVEKGLNLNNLARQQMKNPCRAPDSITCPSGYLRKMVPGRLQDLFALHPQALIQDVAVGTAIAVVLLYFGLYFKRNSKSTLLFTTAKGEERENRKTCGNLLFPEKPLYVFSTETAMVYYQKWKDSLILIDDTSPLDKEALIYMEKEADRYGYTLILQGFHKLDAADLREIGYYVLREEKHFFFFSQQFPQLEAKFLIKQLVRTTKKVVR